MRNARVGICVAVFGVMAILSSSLPVLAAESPDEGPVGPPAESVSTDSGRAPGLEDTRGSTRSQAPVPAGADSGFGSPIPGVDAPVLEPVDYPGLSEAEMLAANTFDGDVVAVSAAEVVEAALNNDPRLRGRPVLQEPVEREVWIELDGVRLDAQMVAVTQLDTAEAELVSPLGFVFGIDFEAVSDGLAGPGVLSIAVDFSGMDPQVLQALGDRLQIVAYNDCEPDDDDQGDGDGCEQLVLDAVADSDATILRAVIPAHIINNDDNDGDDSDDESGSDDAVNGAVFGNDTDTTPSNIDSAEAAKESGDDEDDAANDEDTVESANDDEADDDDSDDSDGNAGDGGVLFGVVSGLQGNSDFGVDRLASLSSYQIGVSSGSVESAYGFVLPPASRGATPTIGLGYSSTAVDFQSTSKNSQPSWVGMGWDLDPGSITRSLTGCPADGELCPLGSERFSLQVGGVSGSLVLIGGPTDDGDERFWEYRLETDPSVRVRRFETISPPVGRLGFIEPTPGGEGLWAVNDDGVVYAYGDASYEGNWDPAWGGVPSVFMGYGAEGYNFVKPSGEVFSLGAVHCGNATDFLPPGDTIVAGLFSVGAAKNCESSGYWLFSNRGAVYGLGAIGFHGAASPPEGVDVVDAATNADRSAYWMLVADGSVWECTGACIQVDGTDTIPNAAGPASIEAGADGGYAIVTDDGGVFNFAGAEYGSAYGQIDGAGANDSAAVDGMLWVMSGRRVHPVGAANASWSVTRQDDVASRWEVTRSDGTVYNLGRGFDPHSMAATYSTRTIPSPDARCADNFGLCDLGYRWDVDMVEDTSGNTIVYSWAPETNFYAAQAGGVRWAYTAASHPAAVTYGGSINTAGVPTTQPRQQAVFVTEDRCVGEGCESSTDPDVWPDTPIDLRCGYAGSCAQQSPGFYTEKRLAQLQTFVLNNAGPQQVSDYVFTESFPEPGLEPGDPDISNKKMVLNSLERMSYGVLNYEGDVGWLTMPAVQYEYLMLKNRKNHPAGVSPMRMPRLNVIVSELGGRTEFDYGQSHVCGDDIIDNIRRPCDDTVRWDSSPEGGPGWVHWMKYKIMAVTRTDLSHTGSPVEVTEYEYPNPPGWAYSDTNGYKDIDDPGCESSGAKCNHWNDFRGHDLVIVTTNPGTPQESRSEIRTFTGMHGDRLNVTGGVFDNSLVSHDGETVDNDMFKRGRRFETVAFNTQALGGAKTSRQLFTYGEGIYDDEIDPDQDRWFVQLRETKSNIYGADPTETTDRFYHDIYGNTVRVENLGDPGTADDNVQSVTDFYYNTVDWLISFPGQTRVFAGTGGPSGSPLSRSLVYYDQTESASAPPTRGLPFWTRELHDGDSTWRQTSLTDFDANGRPTITRDGAGNETAHAYHADWGYETVRTDPNDMDTTFVADPATGATISVTDADGLETTAVADAFGRYVSVDQPGTNSQAARFAYVPSPSKTAPGIIYTATVAAGGGFVESWDFTDGWGRTLQTQGRAPDAETVDQSSLVSFLYDNQGVMRASTAPYLGPLTPGDNGYQQPSDWAVFEQWQDYAYDNQNRRVQTDQNTLDTTMWSTSNLWDGNQNTIVDAEGNQTVRTVGYFGLLDNVEDANNSTISYGYDLEHQLQTVTAPAIGGGSQVTTIDYYTDGAKKSVDDPNSGLWGYTYNSLGLLEDQTDANGTTLTHTYDNIGRPTSVNEGAEVLTSWAYDPAGHYGQLDTATRLDDPAGDVTVSYDYDPRHRVNSTQWSIPGLPEDTQTVAFTYNADNSVNTIAYPTGEVVTQTYTDLSQPFALTSDVGDSYVQTSSYNAQGQPLIVDTGGLWNAFTYQPATSWLDEVTTRADNAQGAIVQQLEYTRDNNANITSLLDIGLGTDPDQQTCYRYDTLDRLTRGYTTQPAAQCDDQGSDYDPNHGPSPFEAVYAYHPNGAIDTANGDGTIGATYTYGDAEHPDAVTTAGDRDYTYDSNGAIQTRTIAGVAETFAYDPQNHLAAISGGDQDNTFTYDASGSRVTRTLGTTTTYYLGSYMEYQVDNGDWETQTSKYSAGGLLVAARTETIADGDETLDYYAQDHQGSTTIQYRDSTSISTRQRYYPYGTIREDGELATDHTYTGQINDADTGLAYYNARYYEPILARFTTADTIVPDPGNSQALNRYMYVTGNPVNLIDPSGNCSSYSIDENGGFTCEFGNNVSIYVDQDGYSTCNTKGYCPQPWKQNPPGPTYSACELDPWLCSYQQGGSGLSYEGEVGVIESLERLSAADFFDLARDRGAINERGLGWLDWSNDGCSNSPDSLGGVSFLGPCAQHDFSYRNRKALEQTTGQNAFSKDSRRAADDRFLDALGTACEDAACSWGAKYVYWTFVHGWGDGLLPNISLWDGAIPGAVSIDFCLPGRGCAEDWIYLN